MLGYIDHALRTREDTLILMPAGSAKTTWGNQVTLCHKISLHKDVRVGLFSQTSDFAAAFSSAIMKTFESNDEHIALFGDIANGGKWTEKEWHRKGSRWATSKDRTVFAGGMGGQVASKRFDLLLCDDILGEGNTKTIDQRESTKLWWDQSLDPRVVADGVRIVFGTRWGPEDLYETLMKPLEEGGYGFRTHIIKALIEDPETETGYRSYWEKVWPVQKLLQLRARNPATFDCVYQQDPRGLLSGEIFQKAWWKDTYFTELPEGHLYTTRMGVDLATSLKERADFTAYVMTSEDICPGECPLRGTFYVLDAHRDKISSGHAGWVSHYYQNRPTWVPPIGLVIIESQQHQSTVVADMAKDYAHVPTKGLPTDSDKKTRATAVAEKYRLGRVRHHVRLRESEFEWELLGFGSRGAHDDWVDALGFSMELGGGSFFWGSVPT